MASIIPGYEYDIFISYRQKDNKYDNWVTEFVDHLKREIEATFKEDISIYFDENPHDGLLEIHNVDKSLEIKLKSVIFIPIISQTYVDPKSFAWQNEFVAFNKMAKEDQFGRDVKLASGNVCSRIIPVKIHDLDVSDTELIENEMGCRFRSIEFIYSSAGVNRPLKPDDNPDKNLNKTYYRDQINKVANAVKDVIYGIHPDPRKRAVKSYQPTTVSGYKEVVRESVPEKGAKGKHLSVKAIMWGSLGILLVAALLIFVPKLLNKPRSEKVAAEIIKKAIAVLPVSNLTGNPGLQYIADAIQSDISGRLNGISSIIVRPDQSTLQFRGSEEPVQQIAKKLSVNNLIQSTMKGTEDNLQVEVRLIEAFPEERNIWSSIFIYKWNSISEIYRDIINKIVEAAQVKLTVQESKNMALVQKHNTDLLKACRLGDYYMKLMTKEGFEKGLKYYNEAMAIDPLDPLPYLGLARGYGESSHGAGIGVDAPNRARDYALKALELDSTLSDAYAILGHWNIYHGWNFDQAEKYLTHAIKLNPNDAFAHCHLGWLYCASLIPGTRYSRTYRMDDAFAEMKKAVEISPTETLYQGYLAWLYNFAGRFEEAINESRKTLQLDPNYTMAYFVMGSSYAEMGMYYEAIEAHKKGIAISPDYLDGLGVAYARAGQKDKALEVVKELEKCMDSWWCASGVAEIYSALGEKDKAIDALEVEYKLGGDFTPFIPALWIYKPLFNEPRFKELVSRFNFPK
jgi:tetratricopeptide (TPR) repeat protein